MECSTVAGCKGGCNHLDHCICAAAIWGHNFNIVNSILWWAIIISNIYSASFFDTDLKVEPTMPKLWLLSCLFFSFFTVQQQSWIWSCVGAGMEGCLVNFLSGPMGPALKVMSWLAHNESLLSQFRPMNLSGYGLLWDFVVIRDFVPLSQR